MAGGDASFASGGGNAGNAAASTTQNRTNDEPANDDVQVLTSLLRTTLKFQQQPTDKVLAAHQDIVSFENYLGEFVEGKRRDDLKTDLTTMVSGNNFTVHNVTPLLQVFDWYYDNYSKPSFTWTDLTPATYLAFKRRPRDVPTIVVPTPDSTITNQNQTQISGNNAAHNRIAPPDLAPTDNQGNSVSGRVIAIDNQNNGNTGGDSLSDHLDFTNDVLALDAQRQKARATPGSTKTLRPHPLWRSDFAAQSRLGINTNIFLKASLALASDEPHNVIAFYQHLCQIAKTAQVDLCPINKFDEAHALWPSNRTKEVVLEMNDILVYKLTQPDVISRAIPSLDLLFRTSLLQSDSQLKAYAFLHKLVKRAYSMLQDQVNIAPAYKSVTQTILEFGTEVVSYYNGLANIAMPFPAVIQSRYFLTQLQQHGVQVDTYLDRLQVFRHTDVIPDDLTLETLVLKLAASRPSNSLVHVVHSAKGQSHQRGSTNNNKGRNQQSDAPLRPFYSGGSIQCSACGSWGHTKNNCRDLGKFALLMQVYTEDKSFATGVGNKWRSSQDKSTRLQTVRHLRQLHPEQYEDYDDDEVLDMLDQDDNTDFR